MAGILATAYEAASRGTHCPSAFGVWHLSLAHVPTLVSWGLPGLVQGNAQGRTSFNFVHCRSPSEGRRIASFSVS